MSSDIEKTESGSISAEPQKEDDEITPKLKFSQLATIPEQGKSMMLVEYEI